MHKAIKKINILFGIKEGVNISCIWRLPSHEIIQWFSLFPGQQLCASEYLTHTNAWNDMLFVLITYKEGIIPQEMLW